MTVEPDSPVPSIPPELPDTECPECGAFGIHRAPSSHPALLYLACPDEACGWHSGHLG
ncbi:hypothetical protein ACIQFU_24765 [Streptomyces sp. NPDC093065]|uniref:hypothetical protein n=1 Tax=Streptomyces sp. NPDC093065 TaxID=3366021 RepID=UPI003809246B